MILRALCNTTTQEHSSAGSASIAPTPAKVCSSVAAAARRASARTYNSLALRKPTSNARQGQRTAHHATAENTFFLSVMTKNGYYRGRFRPKSGTAKWHLKSTPPGISVSDRCPKNKRYESEDMARATRTGRLGNASVPQMAVGLAREEAVGPRGEKPQAAAEVNRQEIEVCGFGMGGWVDGCENLAFYFAGRTRSR